MSKAEGRGRKVSSGGRSLLVLPLAFCLLPFAFSPPGRAQGPQQPQPPAPQTPTPTPTPEPTPDPAPAPQAAPSPTPTPSPSPLPSPAAPASPTPAPSTSPSPAPPAEDEEVERVETSLTNVLLTAVDKNRRFVTTLTGADVRVLEDGVPQEVLAFERETAAPLSLALLVDASASQERVMKDEQAAARDFIASVLRPDRDSAAVVSFTGITRIEQPLTDDRARLNAAIERVRVEYGFGAPECQSDDTPEEVRVRCLTAAWDAVAVSVRQVLSRTPERTRRAVILLSDGDDTGSSLRLHQAVEEAVRGNVVVYAIGIRDKEAPGDLRRDLLRRVSEETGGRAFFPKRPADLAAAFAQIEQELRSQYLISYAPSNRARDARFREIEIEITNPDLRKQKLRLLYRRGYYARPAAGQATN